MDKETKRVLVGIVLVAILVSAAFAWSRYDLRRDASMSPEFRAAAEQAYSAIERAEQSKSTILYEANLLKAEAAIESAQAATSTSRDQDVLQQLKIYKASVIKVRNTLTFLSDTGGVTNKALEVQTAALVIVKTETVKALQQ